MSNPYTDRFTGGWAKIQAEFCNDLVRVFGVDSVDAEKMAFDISSDLGRIDSLKAKSGKIGKFNKDAMADFKVGTEDVQVRMTHRLFLYRLLQESAKFRKEFGAESLEVRIPARELKCIQDDHASAVKLSSDREESLRAKLAIKTAVLKSAEQAKSEEKMLG